MDRKEQYKHKTETVDELRARRRKEEIELRKERRNRHLNFKRIRVSECCDEEDDEEYTEAQVKETTLELIKKSGDRKVQLRQLRKAFIQGTLLSEAFLSVENALTTLVGILTGSDAELQLDAAWSLTNLAAGTHIHTSAVLKEAGAYLITYLESSNHLLQDQCAWALGNVAGDCSECRDTLLAQGILPPLHAMLQSTKPDVVRSAAFALSNLIRGENADTKRLVQLGVIPHLACRLVYDEDNLDMVSEVAWVLTYLTASGEHEMELKAAGILEALPKLLVTISQENPGNHELLTPLLRCLGNLCSGPDEVTAEIMKTEGIIPAMGIFIKAQHRHIKKECLWALSNMTSNSEACQAVVSQDLLVSVVHMVTSTFDIKTEAAYCLCNLASQGASFCEKLLENNAMNVMVDLLKSSDTEVVHLALSFAELVLRNTTDGVKVFEKAGGIDGLELLEYHNNDTLRSQANELLEKYFYKEEVEENQVQENEDKTEGAPMDV